MMLRTVSTVPFVGLSRELNRLAMRDLHREESDSWIPAVDVHEEAQAIVFTAELPGVAKEQVEVTFHEGVLSISGKKASTRTNEDRGVRIAERSFGSFTRRFKLPGDVESGAIEAAHANGVLTVTVPRKASAQPATIAIK
jgi:HSP20 family protein